jgi:hypothetical protein
MLYRVMIAFSVEKSNIPPCPTSGKRYAPGGGDYVEKSSWKLPILEKA